MYMKIALVADIHVGVPGRIDDILWALNQIRDYCNKHKITQWVVLGDFLHDRESINVRDLCELTKFIDDTKKMGQSIMAFPGNHDMYMKNSWEITGVKALSGHIQCINMAVPQFKFPGDERPFCIIPFIHYEDEYMKTVENLSKNISDETVLLTHIGVRDAQLNSCFMLKSWSVVDLSKTKFKKIFAGHFHIHQTKNHVTYVGSPIPFKFDEGDNDHGFIVLDTETLEEEFVSIWWANKKSGAPQFLTLSDELVREKTKDEVDGNVVRVALTQDYTHNQVSEMRTNLMNLGAKAVRFMNLASKEEKDRIEIATQVASMSDLFDRFVEADTKGTEGLNKELLLKLNREIMAEGDKRHISENENEVFDDNA